MDNFPYLAVLGAWVCFGSYAVPMKWESVVDAKVHPLVYQCNKTFWTFVTSHLVLFFEPYEFSWWGVLSGFGWVPAGVAAVVAVQNIGVACGQAVWQVTMILSSMVWGFAVLHDAAVYSWSATLAAVSCMTCGVIGMTFASNQKGKHRSHLIQRFLTDELLDSLDPEAFTNRTPTSIGLGLAAALFVGIWGGSCLVPSQYAPIHGVHFVISFGTGALIANAVLVAAYVAWVKLCMRSELPSLHLRVMALPGFLSGSLWSMGNLCTLHCVAALGTGIGFSLTVSSVMVSGLWGIFYYQELKGRPLLLWCSCCALCLAGAWLLSEQRRAP